MLMSADGGPRKFELEKSAIDEAYRDQIKALFEMYYCDVGSNEHSGKASSIVRFKQRLEALRRAHIQALSVFSDHDQM